jgi:cobalt/nickel transport system ATP-binding protein
MSCLIHAHNLSYRYEDGAQALAGVDFQLKHGETVALLGRNGSGKTTFLLALLGILSAEGSAEICGLPLMPSNLAAIRAKVGFLFQDPDDQLFLPTILEDVSFGPRQQGLPEVQARELAAAALADVGIVDGLDRPPYLLSGGEKQRVALAGLIAARPQILMLDEPTTHLDPPSRRQLVSILHALPQSKLLITHDTGFARDLAGRAVFFEKGRIVADGTVDEIIRRFDWDPAFRTESSPGLRSQG